MRASSLGATAVALLLAACGSNTEQRAATGAGSGVVAGALVGGPIGAVVGAAVGGAGGSTLDEGVDKKAEEALDRRRASSASVSASGSSTAGGAAMSADQVRKRLQQDGYRNVRDLKLDGGVYRATATRGGKTYNLQVDPQSGTVRSRQAA